MDNKKKKKVGAWMMGIPLVVFCLFLIWGNFFGDSEGYWVLALLFYGWIIYIPFIVGFVIWVRGVLFSEEVSSRKRKVVKKGGIEFVEESK